MRAVISPFGPCLPDASWVPAPRYAMRRARIIEVMAGQPRGEIIEMGCGAGALLAEFAALGFDVTGVEMSPESRGCAEIFASEFPHMTVRECPSSDWADKFSYLFSFEVLEHIDDDVAALRDWVGWLKPGGIALISVPAHMKLWGHTDQFSGHFRRYSKEQFRALLAEAGLLDISIESYGFPVSNLIEPVRNAYHGWRLKRGASDWNMQAATGNSGVDRRLEARLFPLMTNFPGRQAFNLGMKMQSLFRNSELGTGWIAWGRKADA